MKIEQVYDQYIAADKLKHGTKYERLAAIIFKLLHGDASRVLHDIRLVGDGKKTNHQIDVVVEQGGRLKRIIVECKEFDKNKKVPLKVARDFKGVCVQLQPHEAIIVTNNGFTKPALTYCREEQLVPLVLRPFLEEDWVGRIRGIELQLNLRGVTEPKVEKIAVHPDYFQRVSQQMTAVGILGDVLQSDVWHPKMVYDDQGNVMGALHELLHPYVNGMTAEPSKEVRKDVAFPTTWHIQEAEIDIPMVGATLSAVGIDMGTVVSRLEAEVAILLVRAVFGEDLNRPVFERELQKFGVMNHEVFLR